ncbi:unnamed protein product, partial [Trichobilharzia regenti]
TCVYIIAFYRDIYTPSPGLPQDLSCRKKCVTLKCDSQKLLVIQEDLEACLPPIATFSHHRESRTNLCSTSVNKSVNLNCKKRSKQTKHNNTENIVYCDLPQCPSFINRKPSKQR